MPVRLLACLPAIASAPWLEHARVRAPQLLPPS
jgi:predicted outer membrane lipoprotein